MLTKQPCTKPWVWLHGRKSIWQYAIVSQQTAVLVSLNLSSFLKDTNLSILHLVWKTRMVKRHKGRSWRWFKNMKIFYHPGPLEKIFFKGHSRLFWWHMYILEKMLNHFFCGTVLQNGFYFNFVFLLCLHSDNVWWYNKTCGYNF